MLARLRRTSRSLEEASGDLGADSWQTFRWVTFPQLRTALLAGALLAFALSFDEVIVTTFTAGPIRRCRSGSSATSSGPNQLPIVNVVARVRDPALGRSRCYFAQRLSTDRDGRPAPAA